MPPLLNQMAVITCPHQTGVVKVNAMNLNIKVGGAPVVTLGDVSTWAVLPGCTQLPTPATPAFVPCVKVLSEMGVGQSLKIKVKGQPVLLQTAQFMTNGVPVGMPATVKFAGQVKVNGI